MIVPVIMAGGSGTRLWPLSRSNFPKQFLSLDGDKTMLQNTLTRLNNFQHSPPVLICNEEHRFIAAEQIRQISVTHNGIILEPFGRNTAPAIALAAFKMAKQAKDSILLVLAADHLIQDEQEFADKVKIAKVLAEQNYLVTFGIVPDKPETGFGYIKKGGAMDNMSFVVDSFVEKPNSDKAKAYLDSGDYLWNSGMFMFKAAQYLKELRAYRPDIYDACERAIEVESKDLDFIRINRQEFELCPDDSIDYAVMEKTNRAVVIPLNAGWSDVGGFSSLLDVSDKDENGNSLKGDVISFDTTNTLAISDDKLVATLGVKDLVIVNTKDAVLVANKDKAQDVKKIVNKLNTQERPEASCHREVYRPWGKYDSTDNGNRFQVKRITVNPGAKLSVQMHHHRAEHWIVVSGTAKVTNGQNEILLTENQSTYIPVGVIHALENPGKVPLELIEVQSGSYLGEDDIVRFEDKYGRK